MMAAVHELDGVGMEGSSFFLGGRDVRERGREVGRCSGALAAELMLGDGGPVLGP
jgi:hypothetical protein